MHLAVISRSTSWQSRVVHFVDYGPVCVKQKARIFFLLQCILVMSGVGVFGRFFLRLQKRCRN